MAMSEQDRRVYSIDVFRGLTIAMMVLVIAVAAGGYRDLPWRASWFGSLPVSAFNHADVAWERFAEARAAEKMPEAEIERLPEAGLRNVGCTPTDLVAPFFVFIVGVCIPLSRARRGGDWWRHVLSRTGMLIGAGVLYISLILGLSWWWGILQAIGVSYLMGAASMKLSRPGRWAAIFGLLAFHVVMSRYVGWWLHFGETARPFFTVSQIDGSWAKPLTVHCRPWVSISYGAMTMIGVLVGEAVATRRARDVLQTCVSVGLLFTVLGLAFNLVGLTSKSYWLCFNKPDVTASYAMFASGVGALTLALLYQIVDVWKVRRWAGWLQVFGANALLAYFMQVIMRLGLRALQIEPLFAGEPNETLSRWAAAWSWQPWKSFLLDKTGYNGLVWGCIWTFGIWLIVRWCNRRGYYWKL